MELDGIIADLREERRKIDNAIAALQGMLEERQAMRAQKRAEKRKTTGRNQEQMDPVAAYNGDFAERGRVIPFTRSMREA